ncbi:MAG: hypothetical protein QM607_03175 [Microbacterium sp.]
MTTITLEITDAIAEQALQEGLLSTQAIGDLLAEATRISAMNRLKGMWQAVPAGQQDGPAPTTDELQAIIRAVRRQRLA